MIIYCINICIYDKLDYTMENTNQAVKISFKIFSSNGKEKTITFTNPKIIDEMIHELIHHTVNENVIKYLEDLVNYCIHCRGYSDTKCYKCGKIVCEKCYEINSHV